MLMTLGDVKFYVFWAEMVNILTENVSISGSC